jgi:hypothetical protein
VGELALGLTIATLAGLTWWLSRNREARPIVIWTRGWLFLFVAAAFTVVSGGAAWAEPVVHLFGPFFPALMLAGALAYADRPVPAWLVPLAFVIGCLRCLFDQAEGSPDLNCPCSGQNILELWKGNAGEDAHQQHDRHRFDERRSAQPFRTGTRGSVGRAAFQLERHHVQHARPRAYEDVERLDRRIRERHAPGPSEYAVVTVREPNVFHASKGGTCVLEYERHAARIAPVLLDLLGLEIHYEAECRLLLFHGGRSGSGTPKNLGRPKPDPHGGSGGEAECQMPKSESLTADAYLSSEVLDLCLFRLVANDSRQRGISFTGQTDVDT